MNKYFLLCCILVFQISYSQTFKNDSVKQFIDKSFTLIQSHSINVEDLEKIKSDLYSKSENLSSVDELVPLYEDVFQKLNDHHGGLKYKGKTYGWQKPLVSNNSYLKEKIKTEKTVHSKVIDKKYGYIRIPGNNDFSFKKVDSLADDIVSHINAVNSNKIKGWIIDLRLNTGGNMYPILLGLKNFIGRNLVFGGFKDAKNQPSGKWEIYQDKMLIDGVELEHKKALEYPIREAIPVIILTSCYTASAGEMTAISFVGRKKTFIVGEPTANYTTAVQGFKINNIAGINLSTDYVIDRNQKVYKNNVIPDFEIIGGDDLKNLENDHKIIKALQLLKR
ncbi:S41 family peptidase [Epilithonimonas zeae]|uniref:S41 family peptidase n=1 Tax=Epilithonimonas zeae TaxID=1416779 RepID=UPI00200ED61B|nr:S41 family peptidase [Epilithonimonas zeae]UQB68163.1 S41 family peptidase [Epilithonimonas zeae]